MQELFKISVPKQFLQTTFWSI